jgi:hypothetical protein
MNVSQISPVSTNNLPTNLQDSNTDDLNWSDAGGSTIGQGTISQDSSGATATSTINSPDAETFSGDIQNYANLPEDLKGRLEIIYTDAQGNHHEISLETSGLIDSNGHFSIKLPAGAQTVGVKVYQGANDGPVVWENLKATSQPAPPAPTTTADEAKDRLCCTIPFKQHSCLASA